MRITSSFPLGRANSGQIHQTTGWQKSKRTAGNYFNGRYTNYIPGNLVFVQVIVDYSWEWPDCSLFFCGYP